MIRSRGEERKDEIRWDEKSEGKGKKSRGGGVEEEKRRRRRQGEVIN